MKLEVNTTSVTQAANELLGSKDKILYYLILGEGEKKLVVNVGEKTHKAVKELTKQK